MAVYDNLYSRFVFWAKIILPLAALGLLSTMFLFARTAGDPGDIPFAEIGEIARDQMITAPTFSGVATDGSLITITAQNAQPQAGNLKDLTIDAPLLTLDASDGTNLSIVAGLGQINNARQTVSLAGLARLETSSGYRMETTELIADLATGTINSLGPLEVRAPFGELSAGLVQIETGQDGRGQKMHFTEGVKMIYVPNSNDR